MKSEDWRVLSEETIFSAPPFIEVSRQSLALPDGRTVPAYYQLKMPDVATVFAETAAGAVIVMRSYRHGARRVCLGFPGGHIAPGEAPLAAARRELLEETGYEAADWTLLGTGLTNANHRGQMVHFFRAAGCRAVQPPDSGDLEESSVHLMERSALDEAMRAGAFPFSGQMALFAWATHPAFNP